MNKLEDGCNICGAVFPAGTQHEHTTQQNSHGGDDRIYQNLMHLHRNSEHSSLGEDCMCTTEVAAVYRNILDEAEQLATRRAVELLRHLKVEADTPFQNVKQTIYVELDKAERKLTAELKGHAK